MFSWPVETTEDDKKRYVAEVKKAFVAKFEENRKKSAGLTQALASLRDHIKTSYPGFFGRWRYKPLLSAYTNHENYIYRIDVLREQLSIIQITTPTNDDAIIGLLNELETDLKKENSVRRLDTLNELRSRLNLTNNDNTSPSP